MGFTKLIKASPNAMKVPPDGVLVNTRAAPGRGKREKPARFATIRIGGAIARKAGFNGQGKADVVVGDGLERMRCGVAAAEKGQFKLTRLTTGDYQVTIPERSAAGLLNFTAPKFAAVAELVPIAAGMPPCVMFDLTREFREP